MNGYRQSVGRWGETLAAAYLRRLGYTILARNVRTPYGELDLVTKFGEVTVFVEVKARTSNQFGPPESAVTSRKREHLLASALYYLRHHPHLDRDWRIDVIAIQKTRGHPPKIVHFENAVGGS